MAAIADGSLQIGMRIKENNLIELIWRQIILLKHKIYEKSPEIVLLILGRLPRVFGMKISSSF